MNLTSTILESWSRGVHPTRMTKAALTILDRITREQP